LSQNRVYNGFHAEIVPCNGTQETTANKLLLIRSYCHWSFICKLQEHHIPHTKGIHLRSVLRATSLFEPYRIITGHHFLKSFPQERWNCVPYIYPAFPRDFLNTLVLCCTKMTCRDISHRYVIIEMTMSRNKQTFALLLMT